MSPYIFIRVSVRPHIAMMTVTYPDRHGATKGHPESEPGAALQDVVSDRVHDAVCVGWFSTVCDLLSTCVLHGASLVVCDGIGLAGACCSACLRRRWLPAGIWTLPDVRE